MTSDWIHQFRCFLRQINPYHFTENINSLADFCTIFLSKMSFILSFYIYFTFIKCCTKYKIPKFIIPTLIHQLWNNFYIQCTSRAWDRTLNFVSCKWNMLELNFLKRQFRFKCTLVYSMKIMRSNSKKWVQYIVK